jgi:hypothetical protein
LDRPQVGDVEEESSEDETNKEMQVPGKQQGGAAATNRSQTGHATRKPGNRMKLVRQVHEKRGRATLATASRPGLCKRPMKMPDRPKRGHMRRELRQGNQSQGAPNPSVRPEPQGKLGKAHWMGEAKTAEGGHRGRQAVEGRGRPIQGAQEPAGLRRKAALHRQVVLGRRANAEHQCDWHLHKTLYSNLFAL